MDDPNDKLATDLLSEGTHATEYTAGLKMLHGKELSRKPTAIVKRYVQIKHDAKLMIEMVNGEFKGHYKTAHALAHHQVRTEPFAFFVVAKVNVEGKVFPHEIICNPVIVEKREKLDVPDSEDTIPNAGPIGEACLSFPNKKIKNQFRYHVIKVTFQTPGLLGRLKKHRNVMLDGLAAHIFQHEVDHCNGINIFYK